jgi:hypothetical protein
MKHKIQIIGIQVLSIFIVSLVFMFLSGSLLDKVTTLKTETEIFESSLPQIDPHNDSQVFELHQALTKKEAVQKAYSDLGIFSFFAGIALLIPLSLCAAWQFFIIQRKDFWKLAGVHFSIGFIGIILAAILFWLVGKVSGIELITLPALVIGLGVIAIATSSTQIYFLKHRDSKRSFIKYRLQTVGALFGIIIIWSILFFITSPLRFLIQGFGFIIVIILIIVLLAREKYF